MGYVGHESGLGFVNLTKANPVRLYSSQSLFQFIGPAGDLKFHGLLPQYVSTHLPGIPGGDQSQNEKRRQ